MADDYFAVRKIEDLPRQCPRGIYDVFDRTCANMRDLNYHTWGFVVYRCTYDDEELWARYLKQLKDFAHEYLVENRRAELLGQYLDFHVIEDRATLENASRQDLRRHFNQWVSNQNLPAGDGFFWSKTVAELPRFRFFLYVDKQCLDTVVQFQNADHGHPYFRSLLPPMVIAVVDGSWTPDTVQSYHRSNEDGYPEIDGSTKRYVGYEYYMALFAAGLYESLHGVGLVDYESYNRPPAIAPTGKDTMPP
ncbi:hypothetical protein CkaCkLH20_03075 [Colletotrichum karsti]|uniref:Uncharacterized protein n=1 Tax=Colletotrichum karsti TaxID=1095194 RepID=A0A9P6IBX3_9PEZI|nr:uncharacterized protein CkaCkLH20_03075 [Colletotrichum karsti]KAF9879532.1 hypothetical protein CkaCkLH20_03075 [Colletotrichum karsti]